jgi:hypothetical protein
MLWCLLMAGSPESLNVDRHLFYGQLAAATVRVLPGPEGLFECKGCTLLFPSLHISPRF